MAFRSQRREFAQSSACEGGRQLDPGYPQRDIPSSITGRRWETITDESGFVDVEAELTHPPASSSAKQPMSQERVDML